MVFKCNLSNLIISVDDFGISKKANENIFELIKIGKIDRVSVMTVNLSRSNKKDFLKLAKTDVKLDLHLVIDSLCDLGDGRKLKEGVVKRGMSFVYKYAVGKISAKQIEQEWRDQIESFNSIFGRMPDGINSHQHTHFFPAYMKILIKLCQEYQIKYVRLGKKGMIDGMNNAFKILKLFWKKNHCKFSQTKLKSSDYLASLDWIADLDAFLQETPKGSIELVCHPERKDEFEVVKMLAQGVLVGNSKIGKKSAVVAKA